MGKGGEVQLLLRPSHRRTTSSPGFQMPSVYSLLLCFLPSFPIDYFQLLNFLCITFSSWVPRDSISLSELWGYLWFVSDLDLRALGHRGSCSQFWGISGLAHEHFVISSSCGFQDSQGNLKKELDLWTVAQRRLGNCEEGGCRARCTGSLRTKATGSGTGIKILSSRDEGQD